MSQSKTDRKSLRGPDLLQVKTSQAADWAVKNSKQLAILTVPVVAIIGIGLGWNFWQQNQANERQNALGAIELSFQDELKAAQDKREELDKQIGDLRKKDREAQEATKKDKKKAKVAANPKIKELEDQRKEIKPDHAGSLASFQEFFKANSGKAEGWRAGITAAGIMVETKNFEGAQTLLKDITEASAASTFYQVQSRWLYMNVLEERGAFPEALQQSDTLIKLVNDDLKPAVLLARGRLHLLAKSNDEARKEFDKLIQDFSTSQEARKAESLRYLLN